MITNLFINNLSDLLWNSWQALEKIDNNNDNNNKEKDSRIEWFKLQSYDRMDATIKDLEKLIDEMKLIRKSKLDKEIEDTEARLKCLKGNL
jgi:hypothetical protein